jgi:hypothetical protein
MTTTPLTHHEILELVEPFVRRGRHPDLPVSDRVARRIAFKALEHAGDTPGSPGLHDTLQLDHLREGRYRLTRVLAHPSGAQARLVTEGAQPGELLARIECIAPWRQVRTVGNFVIAWRHRLEASDGTPGDAAKLVLTDAEARGECPNEWLKLTMDVPSMKGVSGEIKVFADAAEGVDLPDDMLAVQGRDWDCFRHIIGGAEGWRSNVKLRGSGEARSDDAEHKFECTIEHVARTLAEPPARFHERWTGARWRVFMRRMIPLGICIGLIAGAAAVPYMGIADDSVIHMLLFNAPPLLLVLFFSMRELPRIEVPPLPSRLRAAAWRSSRNMQTG